MGVLIDLIRDDTGKKITECRFLQGGTYIFTVSKGLFGGNPVFCTIFDTAISHQLTQTGYKSAPVDRADIRLTMPYINAGGYIQGWDSRGNLSQPIPCAIGSGTMPPAIIPDKSRDIMQIIGESVENITDNIGKSINQGIEAQQQITQAIKWTIICIMAISVVALAFYAFKPSAQAQSAAALKDILDSGAAKELTKASKMAALKGAA